MMADGSQSRKHLPTIQILMLQQTKISIRSKSVLSFKQAEWKLTKDVQITAVKNTTVHHLNLDAKKLRWYFTVSYKNY